VPFPETPGADRLRQILQEWVARVWDGRSTIGDLSRQYDIPHPSPFARLHTESQPFLPLQPLLPLALPIQKFSTNASDNRRRSAPAEFPTRKRFR
jgi:hypothetical protein